MLRSLPCQVRVDENWSVERLMQFPRLEGVVAVGHYSLPFFRDIPPRSLVLFTQDPTNAGSIIRTAVAHGITHIFMGPGAPHPCNPLVLRSSAGASLSASYASQLHLKRVCMCVCVCVCVCLCLCVRVWKGTNLCLNRSSRQCRCSAQRRIRGRGSRAPRQRSLCS